MSEPRSGKCPGQAVHPGQMTLCYSAYKHKLNTLPYKFTRENVLLYLLMYTVTHCKKVLKREMELFTTNTKQN